MRGIVLAFGFNTSHCSNMTSCDLVAEPRHTAELETSTIFKLVAIWIDIGYNENVLEKDRISMPGIGRHRSRCYHGHRLSAC